MKDCRVFISEDEGFAYSQEDDSFLGEYGNYSDLDNFKNIIENYTDKLDRNDRKIYSGDMIKVKFEYFVNGKKSKWFDEEGVVYEDESGFKVHFLNENSMLLYQINSNHIEIIGHIHE